MSLVATPALHLGPAAGAGRWAIVPLALAMLLAAVGTSIATVALPALTAAFGAPFAAVQWVVLAYLLAVTSLVVGAGRLGDLVGRRRLLVAGLLLFAAASALCGAAASLWLLIAGRAMQGLAAAAMAALALAAVGDCVPAARSGSAMGLLGAASAAGTALGPALGGLLIAAFSWRSVFLAGVPLALLAAALAWRFLPVDRAAPALAPRFDAPGTILLALALAAYALAMTAGGEFGARSLALLALAAAGFAAFAAAQRRASHPLLPPALLRSPELRSGLALNALVAAVAMTTLVVGPFHLSGALGLGAAGTGLAMSAGPIVAALVGFPAGRLVDRLRPAPAIRLGLGAVAVGAALIAAMPLRLGVAGYVAPLVLLTAGYALFQAANNRSAMAGAAAQRRGLVSGLLNLSRNLGLVTGASAMAAFYSAAGLSATFAAAAAAVAAAMLALGRRPVA